MMQTKDRILEAAEKLIMQNGFNATSVADICAAAKISKGGFFHCFSSKQALAEGLIQYFAEKMAALLNSGVNTEIKNSKKRLIAFLDFMIATSKKTDAIQGCIVGIASQELALSSSDIQQTTKQAFEPGLMIIKELLQAVKTDYNLKIDCDKVAHFFLANVQGSMLIGRGTGYNQHLYNNLCIFKNYLTRLIDTESLC